MPAKKSTNVDKNQWSSSSNIQVVVRCRPISENEKKAKEEEVVRVLDGSQLIVRDPGHTAVNDMRKRRVRDRQYAFDHAFGPGVSTEEVFEKTTKTLIDGIVNGYNATVFAYGATGSGKTHSMLGKKSEPGLMVLTLRDLYAAIERVSRTENKSYTVKLSYVEVYNENIRDLLTTTDEYLDLREDSVKGTCVAGVSEHSVSGAEQIMDLLQEGNRRRTQEPTAANRESSRSHAVLQILVTCKYAGKPTKAGKAQTVTRSSKLCLIDLAGSERATNTKNSGIRLIEGANINRSLLALGNCITALVQGKGTFVPYRDSKLTRLLKDSLGGNCKTVMLSCISPCDHAFEETCNTLKYANRAKNIKTTVVENIAKVSVDPNAQISQYDDLITGLKAEVEGLKMKLVETMRAAPASAQSRGHSHPLGLGLGVNSSSNLISTLRAVSSPSPSRRLKSPLASATSPRGFEVSSQAADAFSHNQHETSLDGSFRTAEHAPAPSGEQQLLDAQGRAISVHDLVQDPSLLPEGFVLVDARAAAEALERLSSLRESLLSNFQERMQLKRSLIEIAAQNVTNTSDIERRQRMLAKLSARALLKNGKQKKDGAIDPAVFEKMGLWMKDIQDLQAAVASNNRTRDLMTGQLEALTRASEALKTQLEEECNSTERSELLALEYRVGLLELEKVELEQSALVAQRQLLQRAEEVSRATAANRRNKSYVQILIEELRKNGIRVPPNPHASKFDEMEDSEDAHNDVDSDDAEGNEDETDSEALVVKDEDEGKSKKSSPSKKKEESFVLHSKLHSDDEEGSSHAREDDEDEEDEDEDEEDQGIYFDPQLQNNSRHNAETIDIRYNQHFTGQNNEYSTSKAYSNMTTMPKSNMRTSPINIPSQRSPTLTTAVPLSSQINPASVVPRQARLRPIGVASPVAQQRAHYEDKNSSSEKQVPQKQTQVTGAPGGVRRKVIDPPPSDVVYEEVGNPFGNRPGSIVVASPSKVPAGNRSNEGYKFVHSPPSVGVRRAARAELEQKERDLKEAEDDERFQQQMSRSSGFENYNNDISPYDGYHNQNGNNYNSNEYGGYGYNDGYRNNYQSNSNYNNNNNYGVNGYNKSNPTSSNTAVRKSIAERRSMPSKAPVWQSQLQQPSRLAPISSSNNTNGYNNGDNANYQYPSQPKKFAVGQHMPPDLSLAVSAYGGGSGARAVPAPQNRYIKSVAR